MTESALGEIDVRSVGLRDEMRIYTTKFILSEYGERFGFYPLYSSVDFNQKEEKFHGRICVNLVNEIVKNIKGVSYIAVDFHSLTIVRNMEYGWSQIEPKLFDAIGKALRADSEILGNRLP